MSQFEKLFECLKSFQNSTYLLNLSLNDSKLDLQFESVH